MTKQITWLGDEDSSVQQITQFGHTFVKGVPTDVDAKDPNLSVFEENQYFSVGKTGDVIDSDAPNPLDPEEGTKIGAVKADLDALGVKYRANASLESLRKLLADALDA